MILRFVSFEDERAVGNRVDVNAFGNAVSLQIRLREDVMVLKFLEPDVFASGTNPERSGSLADRTLRCQLALA